MFSATQQTHEINDNVFIFQYIHSILMKQVYPVHTNKERMFNQSGRIVTHPEVGDKNYKISIDEHK